MLTDEQYENLRELWLGGCYTIQFLDDELMITIGYDPACEEMEMSDELIDFLKQNENKDFLVKIHTEFEGGYEGSAYQPPEEPIPLLSHEDLGDNLLNEFVDKIIEYGIIEFDLETFVFYERYEREFRD